LIAIGLDGASFGLGGTRGVGSSLTFDIGLEGTALGASFWLAEPKCLDH
jgi:hypothetical protein